MSIFDRYLSGFATVDGHETMKNQGLSISSVFMKCCLLVIDVQESFRPTRSVEQALARMVEVA